MDPFGYKVGSNYLADIHRTYNRNIPKPTYDRALQFREDEKRKIDALVAENELLRQVDAHRRAIASENSAILSNFRSKLSKIRLNGASSDRRDSSPRTQRVPPVQASVREGDGGGSRDVPGDTLLPNLRGPSSEHVDEGRPNDDDGVAAEPTGGDVQEK